MKPLLFFLPGLDGFLDTSRSNPVLHERGLDRVFEGTRPQCVRTERGPGGRGVIVPLRRTEFDKDDVENKLLVYKEDEQVWESCFGGKYWIGYWIDRKPGPSDLIRQKTHKGHDVELDDGSKWLVPVIRYNFSEETALPQIMKLNPDGSVFRKESPRYSDLVALANDYWSRFMNPDPTIVVPWSLVYDIAGYSLELNYHMNKWILSALELVNENNIRRIAEAACDWPSVQRVLEARKEAQKKNLDATMQDGQSTSPGD